MAWLGNGFFGANKPQGAAMTGRSMEALTGVAPPSGYSSPAYQSMQGQQALQNRLATVTPAQPYVNQQAAQENAALSRQNATQQQNENAYRQNAVQQENENLYNQNVTQQQNQDLYNQNAAQQQNQDLYNQNVTQQQNENLYRQNAGRTAMENPPMVTNAQYGSASPWGQQSGGSQYARQNVMNAMMGLRR